MASDFDDKMAAFVSFILSDIIRLQGNTSEDAHAAFMKKCIADANKLDALLKEQYKKDPAASMTFENGGWLKSGMFMMWKHHHAFLALRYPEHEIHVVNAVPKNTLPGKAVFVNNVGDVIKVQEQ